MMKKWLTWRQSFGHKNKEKSFKSNTVCYHCWSPRYKVSALSTKCGVYHPKGLIAASLYQIIITLIIIITILHFARQFSFLLDNKNKIIWNSQKTWKICKFWFACSKNLQGLLVYLVSYFANSIRRKFSTNGGISSLT